MTKDEQIREALKAFAGNSGGLTLLAEVKDVDEGNAIISVNLGNDILIENVRLRATIDGDNGFFLMPQVGSKVLLLRLGESDEFFVAGFSKYDKVKIKGESISLEVNQETIIFNENALSSFMPDINKLVEKINSLEQQINDLKTVFKNWVPAPQDGGAQLKSGITSWASQIITKTKVDDIKDEKIMN